MRAPPPRLPWRDGPARLWRTLRPLPPALHAHRVGNEVRKRAWRRWLPQLVTSWRRAAARRVIDPSALCRLGRALAAAPAPARSPASDGQLVAAGRHIGALPPTSWRLADARPLEVYEAHYLGWAEALVATGAAEDLARCWAAVESWHGAAATLSQAWEPYPRARRALSCLRVAGRLAVRLPGQLPEGGAASGSQQAALLQTWLVEIALTAALPLPWLMERHLGGNHLLVDRVAVAAAEAALAGGTSPGPQATAMHAAAREWRAQFAPDGSHLEGSPMYHALLLEDALTLAALHADDHDLTADIAQATSWLKAMVREDCTLPAFGDTDPTMLSELPLVQAALADASPTAPDPAWSAWRADSPDSLLADAGATSGSSVIVHAGAMVYAPQPGHAHADGLSIDYTCQGQRVLCDAGLSGYEQDPMRPWNRSEAAHSVVEIPGQPQLELWGAFRVGARGETHVAATGEQAGWRWLRATLTWPERRHHLTRFVALGPRGSLYVVDQLTQRVSGSGPALQRLRLHESITASGGPLTWRLSPALADGDVSAGASSPPALLLQSSTPLLREPSRRFPQRGACVPTSSLVAHLPASGRQEVLLSPVDGAGAALWSLAALRLLMADVADQVDRPKQP